MALGWVTRSAEMNRDPDDKIKTGKIEYPKGPKYHLGGIYMIYRGSSMKKSWID